MPSHPVPRATQRLTVRRGGWVARIRAELASTSPEHDLFIKLVIVERFVRSGLLALAAVSLLVVGGLGYLQSAISWTRQELDLELGTGPLEQLAVRGLDLLGRYPHETGLAIGVLLFSALEVVEAVGLARRRRWAEYLTVVATSVLIPLEVAELVRRPTVFRAGALVLNVAIVVWLAYRKRLFVSVLAAG